MLPILLLLVLPVLVKATCPTGCECLPALGIARCDSFDRIPTIDSTVTNLRMTNCQFASPVLQRTNFTGLQHLKELVMTNCGLTNIEYNAFADMTQLQMLDISRNQLNVIPEGALRGLRLQDLYMEDNPALSLSEKSFSGVTTGVLKLGSCNLREVKLPIFQPLLPHLRKLFLDDNQIERFDPAMLILFNSLESTRIYGNPLHCDCQSKWLKEFYDLNKDTTKLRESTVQEPRCSSPDSLVGKYFQRLTIEDFSCANPTLHSSVSFTNDKGTLSCMSRGTPVPTVSWYRPNGIVTRSIPQGNMAVNNNTIELLAGEPNIRGQYQCVASNDGGNTTLTINVDWPFQQDAQPCDTTTKGEIMIPVGEPQKDVFKEKYFTLVDLIGAILGTFVSTLVITVVTLHFCVYRRKQNSQYATPPMSEYSSSSNGSMKNAAYPVTMSMHHTMPAHPHIMHSQRPLPSKPYHKGYDENHYMATNLDERDEFLRISGQSSHSSGRMTPSTCEFCPSCRTLPSQPHLS